MGYFDSLLKTKNSKRKYQYDYRQIYKKGRFATSVDYNYFENLYSLELLDSNKKKYNQDLLSLWGKLDMKSYIDYDLGNTINMYFLSNTKKPIPINQLDDYNFMPEDTRKLNLLDIKYIKHLKLENIIFNNLYLATYDILDNNGDFRPYVLLFTKNESDDFIDIGYGYDSNNNGNVELFIQSFNYPVFLTSTGVIILPLANKKVKLNVYDYITDLDIQKMQNKK